MNKKKNKNNETCLSGDDVPLTSDEYELYHQLLSLSYPQPQKSIKEGVMEQIRADSSAEASQKRKKTRNMNRFVKYGSIAACFILIIGVVIGISPILNGMSKSDNASMTADIAADCASYENTMATYAATDTAPTTDIANPEAEDAGMKKPAVMSDMLLQSAGVPETSAEAPAETEAARKAEAAPEILIEEAVEEAVEEDGFVEEDADAIKSFYAAANGLMSNMAETENKNAAYTGLTDSVCETHGAIYHTFSDELTEYVGDEAFYTWYYSEEAADECGIPSVATFVAYFNINRDLFASLVAESEIPYDIDVIYPSAIVYTLR